MILVSGEKWAIKIFMYAWGVISLDNQGLVFLIQYYTSVEKAPTTWWYQDMEMPKWFFAVTDLFDSGSVFQMSAP